MRKVYILVLFFLAISFLNANLFDSKFFPLKGLKEVKLRVHINSSVENLQEITELNEYSLTAFMEEKLINSGLKVTSKEKAPELVFHVIVSKSSFIIWLFVREEVRIERSPEHICKAYTWHGGFGSHVVIEGRENLLKPVLNLLDVFLEDYKNDNPKKDNKNI